MKLFISWSGDQGKCVAEGLDKIVRRVIQSVKPWISSRGIAPGEWWRTKLFEALNECDGGIICLTEHALNAAWLHYEAGALVQKFKEPKNVRIWTYLFGIGRDRIKGPLEEIQHSLATREDTRRMLLSIKKFADAELEDDVFEDSFAGAWGQMEQVFEKANKLSPTTSPAPPSPDAERDLILKEILRTQIDLQKKVDSALTTQSTDLRKIIHALSERPAENRISKAEMALLRRIVSEFNKAAVDYRVRQPIVRDSFEGHPPSDAAAPEESPPEDEVPF